MKIKSYYELKWKFKKINIKILIIKNCKIGNKIKNTKIFLKRIPQRE